MARELMDSTGWGEPTECCVAEHFLAPGAWPEYLARIDADLRALNGAGISVSQVLYLPDDETCFTLLETTAVDDITRASEAFKLGYTRVQPARTVRPTKLVTP